MDASEQRRGPGKETDGHGPGKAEAEKDHRIGLEVFQKEILGRRYAAVHLLAIERYPAVSVGFLYGWHDGHQQETGNTHQDKGQLPGAELTYQWQYHLSGVADHADDETAKNEGKTDSDVNAHEVNRHRLATLLLGEVVGNHGIGRWRQAGLADTHT